jgi:hypothetical protein
MGKCDNVFIHTVSISNALMQKWCMHFILCLNHIIWEEGILNLVCQVFFGMIVIVLVQGILSCQIL